MRALRRPVRTPGTTKGRAREPNRRAEGTETKEGDDEGRKALRERGRRVPSWRRRALREAVMRAGRGRTHRPSRGDSAAQDLQSDHQVRSPINRPEWNTIPSQVMWVPSGPSSLLPFAVNTIWASRRTMPYRLATELCCRYRSRLAGLFLVRTKHSKSGAMCTNLYNAGSFMVYLIMSSAIHYNCNFFKYFTQDRELSPKAVGEEI